MAFKQTGDPGPIWSSDVHEATELDPHPVSKWRYQQVFDELDKIAEECADDQLATPVTPCGDPQSCNLPPLVPAPDTPVSVVGSTAPDRVLLRATMAEAIEKYRADAKKNGRIAQAQRAVDLHRATSGKPARNKKRRIEYALGILSEHGREVRAYEKATQGRRAAQKKASKNKNSAALSKDERDAIRDKDRLRKREARAAHAAIAERETE